MAKPILTSLSLNQLELNLYLGCLEFEKKEIQRVLCDIKIDFATPSTACDNDQLTDTQCYDDLIKSIEKQFSHQSFALVEHFAKTLHQFIKKFFPDNVSVKVSITKFPIIKNLTGGVTFSYGEHY